MAYRDGDRITRVLVEASLWDFHLRREHARDLRLVGVPITGEDDFDLARLVLEDRNTALFQHREDRAARLGHGDRARGVASHEQLFQRRLLPRISVTELTKMAL